MDKVNEKFAKDKTITFFRYKNVCLRNDLQI